MNIAIVGYGKMGMMIHELALSQGHTVSSIVDVASSCANVTSRSIESVKGCDVVIDFSSPSSCISNIEAYMAMGVKAVIGTTGWYDKIDYVKKLVTGNNCLMYSGNFSVGVAVFLKIAERAASLIDALDEYDIAISETHHRGKADSPSGTAIMIAQKIISNIERKKKVVLGNPEGKIKNEELLISSLRLGSVCGIHSVEIDSTCDSITLTHTARSREGFALGAIKAAEWLMNKQGGLYSMDDFINELLKEKI